VAWYLAFAAMAGPLIWLIILILNGGVGANPIEFINRYLGDWALRTLLIGLSATPLKLIFGWSWPIRMRRMLGLWAFAYVALHFVNYIAIEQFFDWSAIGKDIVKRTYITVGMGALIIMTTLAVTSNKWSIKRLGGKEWLRIHRYVYAAGILGCWHYYAMVKADTLPPLIHAGVLAGLFGIRIWYLVIKPAIT
jgi:sulfoxide reductase heme-binding subunit YedZ